MINTYAYLNSCYLMPNFEYCKEYITTPFYASETDIMNEISKEYEKYKNTLVEEEENKEEKSFLDKLRDFYQKNYILCNWGSFSCLCSCDCCGDTKTEE